MSLWDELRAFWTQRRQAIHEAYTRTLPLGDYVVDRWDKARALGFGEGTSIYDTAYVFGEVRVGKDTWIGPFVVLDGSGGLTIGDTCSISAGVQIYSHDTVRWATSGGAEPYEYAPTRIGHHCYVGPNAVIAKGVTVGDGAVIGANSLVLSDVDPGARVGGTPARPLGAGRS
ncbi:acyltransferase [Qipengyuania sediminis]|uniref:acyltransferase n=1 Tax=Qipengyuania sediminis TaxID=1532023 RepID=UPI00105A4E07|nr:acyltransferase [Qipengyuania sediminis]